MPTRDFAETVIGCSVNESEFQNTIDWMVDSISNNNGYSFSYIAEDETYRYGIHFYSDLSVRGHLQWNRFIGERIEDTPGHRDMIEATNEMLDDEVDIILEDMEEFPDAIGEPEENSEW